LRWTDGFNTGRHGAIDMHTPNRLDAVNDTDPSLGGAPQDESQDRDVLAELRGDLAAIVADLTKVVEARSAQAKVVADQGLEAARDTIRTHPVMAIAVAALLGAGVAIALTSAPRRSRAASRISDWIPPVPRAAVMHMADGMQHAAVQSSTLSSLASAFERMVEQLSTIDPKSSLTPALEKAGSWLNSVRSAMGGK
jgi:ElaB/YqjD/DUF883 family membrane-anchored ribosome-binding protein